MSNDMLFRNYIVVKKYNILRYEAQGIYVMQLEICCFIEGRGGGTKDRKKRRRT